MASLSIKPTESEPVSEPASEPTPVPAAAPVEPETTADATDATTDETDMDIYNSKVIACAIDNPEACTMCSG
ncbi:unnamed protein product [[Candida] boidinii]|nr:unnamed protein product [[Candida] boidinii]